MKGFQIPEGWTYTPGVRDKPPCPCCGLKEPPKPGVVVSPSGARIELPEGLTAAMERDMARRLIGELSS